MLRNNHFPGADDPISSDVGDVGGRRPDGEARNHDQLRGGRLKEDDDNDRGHSESKIHHFSFVLAKCVRFVREDQIYAQG